LKFWNRVIKNYIIQVLYYMLCNSNSSCFYLLVYRRNTQRVHIWACKCVTHGVMAHVNTTHFSYVVYFKLWKALVLQCTQEISNIQVPVLCKQTFLGVLDSVNYALPIILFSYTWELLRISGREVYICL